MARIRQNSRVGPYTVIRALPEGKGGMARIYEAIRLTEEGTELRVALKVARTAPPTRQRDRARREELEQFYFEALNNEVEYLKRLKHPSIVRLYPIPWAKGMKKDPYIARATNIAGAPWFCVMEYLQGGSLENRVRRLKQLPLREAVEIAHQISLALDYIHSKGVAHLDVKPDNVLFRYPLEDETRPEAVLIDFGIARREGKKYGLEAGALPYMPPERLLLLRGNVAPEIEIDKTLVDVYGLGILLYKMLTGRLPFGGTSRSSITSAILHQTPTRPSRYNHDIPPAVEDIILQALDKDPQRRPSAQMLASMLDEAMSPPRYVLLTGKGAEDDAEPRRQPLNRLMTAGFFGFMMLSALQFGVIWTLLRSPTLSSSPATVPTSPPTLVKPAAMPVTPSPTSASFLTPMPSSEVVASPSPTPTWTLEMTTPVPTPTPTKVRPTPRPSPSATLTPAP